MSNSNTTIYETNCCIAGGGPCGMMLAYLLARSGIDVIVLEKHEDFFRDFRGDTVHPSTLELLSELGILEDFLRLPHQKMHRIQLNVDGSFVQGPDFSSLNAVCKYIAFVPQWDFLNFIAEQGRRYKSFQLMMNAQVLDVEREGSRISGVRVMGKDGLFVVRAPLTIAADGRHSTVREKLSLPVKEIGVPIDVLWFRLKRPEKDFSHSFGTIQNGRMLIAIDRGAYIQAAYVISKGSFENLKQKDIASFRSRIEELVPGLTHAAEDLSDWGKVKLLTVQINRLTTWYHEGALCLGDAAHAMSPAGGVGINLAIQDAVAAANMLVPAYAKGRPDTECLRRIQKRRTFPTVVTQSLQRSIHKNVFSNEEAPFKLPWLLSIMLPLFAPLLRLLAARFIGIGVRPEHIETKENLLF